MCSQLLSENCTRRTRPNTSRFPFKLLGIGPTTKRSTNCSATCGLGTPKCVNTSSQKFAHEEPYSPPEPSLSKSEALAQQQVRQTVSPIVELGLPRSVHNSFQKYAHVPSPGSVQTPKRDPQTHTPANILSVTRLHCLLPDSALA